jgi:hypothetical protein
MAAKLMFAAAHLSLVVTQQLVPGVEHKFLGPTNVRQAMPTMVDVKPLSLDPGPQEIQDMESTIEALAANGENPAHNKAIKQLLEFLVETIIPNRERQLKFDQEQLDSESNDIKQCSVTKVQKSDMVLNEKMDRVADHKENYVQSTVKFGDCKNVEEAKGLVKDAHCHSVQDAETVCSCHDDIVKVVGPRGNCTGSSIKPDLKECCDKFAAHKLHQIECQNLQHEIHYAQRQSALIMQKICADYSTCFDEQTKEYKDVEHIVKGNEERRSLKTLYTMQCLVHTFEGENSTEQEVRACKEKKYDVKTIKYPETVAKDSCTVLQDL